MPNASFLSLLTPVAVGLGASVVLLIIFSQLPSSSRLRALGPVYVAATLLLGLALVLDGEGLLPLGWPRDVLLATLVVGWGYIVFDLLEYLAFERSLARRGMSVPRLVRDILRALALIALLLLVTSRIFGVSLSSIVISSTVASAVIGLALQDLLRNVIAGIALQIEQPFAPGNWVLLRDQPMRVLEMSWRATRFVTVDNTHVVVPNANLAQIEISNYSLISPVQALHVQITLDAEHPPDLVKRVLARAALAAEGVVPNPAPGVRLITYGEACVTYDIKFWMSDFERYIETRDAVMTNIWYHTRRANLRLSISARELFVHEADAHLLSEKQAHALRQVETVLARVELFADLSPAEHAALATRVAQHVYGCGEVLVRQGDLDDTLFVIVAGRVRVEAVHEPGGPAVQANVLHAGDFFGEMALLTGTPRRATVIAEEDTTTLVVGREALAPLFEANPALPERLSEALERRDAQNSSALAALTPAASPNEAAETPTLLSRMRSLFGLGGSQGGQSSP
ncbi:MAG: mechanosensitive ion channel family protein [Chloroflexales bacterium]